jgi:hypothetical protein
VTIHKKEDRKGNTVIEKDTHREGIAGSTDTHTKTETDHDGGTTTTRETTTSRGRAAISLVSFTCYPAVLKSCGLSLLSAVESR